MGDATWRERQSSSSYGGDKNRGLIGEVEIFRYRTQKGRFSLCSLGFSQIDGVGGLAVDDGDRNWVMSNWRKKLSREKSKMYKKSGRRVWSGRIGEDYSSREWGLVRASEVQL